MRSERAPDDDAFYIGYQPAMAPPLRAHVRCSVGALFVLAIGVSLALVLAQRGFSSGTFEYGTTREFVGFVEAVPVPTLLVPRDNGAGAASRYLLVESGKRGAASRVAPFDGKRVRIEGTLVYRAGTTMLEIESIAKDESASGSIVPRELDVELGAITLRGEIVDSKCWLGVMKPGEWKPHRACATRCIAGGIPPLFVVDSLQTTGKEGEATDVDSLQFLLVGARGEAVNEKILDRIAEPLEIQGRAVRRGTTLFLYADPDSYRRLN